MKRLLVLVVIICLGAFVASGQQPSPVTRITQTSDASEFESAIALDPVSGDVGVAGWSRKASSDAYLIPQMGVPAPHGTSWSVIPLQAPSYPYGANPAAAMDRNSNRYIVYIGSDSNLSGAAAFFAKRTSGGAMAYF